MKEHSSNGLDDGSGALPARWRTVAAVTAAILMIVGWWLGTAFWLRSEAAGTTAARTKSLEQLIRDLRTQPPWLAHKIVRWDERNFVQRRRSFLPPRLVKVALSVDMRAEGKRESAKWELIRRGTNAWPAIPVLLQLLQRPDNGLCWYAVQALCGMRSNEHPDFARLVAAQPPSYQFVQTFLWLLKSPEDNCCGVRLYDTKEREWSQRRRFTLACLTAMGRGASPLALDLVVLFRSKEDHEIRALAVGALGAIGPAARESSPLLKAALQNPDEWPDVRAAAAQALAVLAPADEELSSLLRQEQQDPSAHVRAAAARASWALHAPADEVLPTLTSHLHHKLASVRLAALTGLGEMGASARPSKADIERLTQDQDDRIRRAAIAALEKTEAGLGPVPKPARVIGLGRP